MPLPVQTLSLANITTAGAVTYSPAQIVGGLITRNPSGAGRSDVTPTATRLIAEASLRRVGDTVWCYLINTATAAEAITITAGTGVTVVNGDQTVGQNESALLLFRKTGEAAISCYVLGA